MEPKHSLLRRQLKRYVGGEAEIPEPWASLIGAVDEAYAGFDADRKMLERSLELSSQELLQASAEIRAIFQAIPDLLLRVDRDGTILMLKAGTSDDLLFAAEDMMGRKIQSLPAGDIGHRFGEAIARVTETRRVVTLEYSLAVGGRTNDYEARLVPALDDQMVVIIRNITERKRAEVALVTSEQRYRALFEHSPLPKWVYDLETLRIVDVNEAALANYGYTREEFLAMTIRDIRPREDVPALENDVAQARQGGASIGEWRHRKKDGTVIEVVVHAHDIDAGGRRARMVIAQDITARKAAEEALRAAEEKYRTIFENATEGIFRSTPDGRLLAANPALARILGYSSPEVLIRERTDIAQQGYADPRHRDEFKRRIEQHGAVTNLEREARRRDGSLIWVSENARVVRDETGRVLYYEGTLEDITERRRTEAELQATRRQLERVLGKSPTVVYSLAVRSGETTPTYVSANVAAMFGYTAEETLQRHWWREHIHPGDLPRVTREMALLYEQNQATHDYRFQHRNGSYRWVRDEQRLIRDGDNEAVEIVGAWTDVTEHLELESRLRQSQKMEAVGQLAGGVAHDFNNLLTVIKGYSQILVAEDVPPAEARELLREIFDAATRAGRLTQQLLSFSRKQAIRLQDLDLNEVVTDLGKMLQRVIGEDVVLALDCAPDLPLVRADAGMMEQVVLNLAVNARDAMTEGGRLSIRTERKLLVASASHNGSPIHTGEYARLSVTDTGSGISPETKSRLFEPFFTTKEPGKGTGLGLATVYGIVQQHGGWIDVETEIGKGSTFTIFLPAASDVARVSAPKSEPGRPKAGTETILLVEDDASVRQLARMILQRAGYRVFDAGSAPSASAIWNEHRAEIQLLVTDLILPGGSSGSSFALRLQAERPELRVIFTSGYSTAASRRGVQLTPNVNFLQKPYLPNALAKIVRDCLDAPHLSVADGQ